MDDAGRRLSRYLFLQFLVNASYGVVFGFGLCLIRLPHALLWGVLAGLLRLVPYIGTLCATVFPVALALAVFPGWTQAIWIAGKRLRLFRRLLPEDTGLTDLSGQRVNPRHNPALLSQWWQGDFTSEQNFRPYGGVTCSAFGLCVQPITLMEEICHSYFKHKPTKLLVREDGVLVRDFNGDQEKEAFGVGAAVLIPWSLFFHCLDSGMSADEMADEFDVTPYLVQYRINITGGSKLYAARQRARSNSRAAGI